MCTVLLEGIHVSNNAGDHWQQYFWVILTVDISHKFNENKIDVTQLQFCIRHLCTC